MKAVILSGGQSLRMRPLTDDKPKALVDVKGRPIAEYQVEWLVKEGGIDSVVFACGYKWERLKEHFGSSFKGTQVEYSVEEEPLGTGGAVKRAISDSDEELWVVANGDIMTNLPLGKMIAAHKQASDIAASMLVVPYRSRFGVVKIDKLKVVRGFEEKPAFPDVWINGGIYVLNGKKAQRYLPDKGDIERDTFPKLVNYGELLSYPYYGEWFFVDSLKDLKELEDSLQQETLG
ncbi:MAG TPA: nucleotidyltransferase family protein [Nitrososphaerales archaeon]|nr:nucleotidyltransferase family protein [Nitrososphaerales archaeon]